MLRKGKFQGLYKCQIKRLMVFRILGKVSNETQGFRRPLDSFQGFQSF